ncbi:hypothetical protein Lser_V15G35008 [Lactuca serriola]
MERKSKSPSPPSSEHDEERSADEEEEVQHHASPRGNTPPRSPTPTEQLHDKIRTPTPSPPKTTVPVSVAPIPPLPTSQTTTSMPPPPPVSIVPISTTPLPPPIFSQATTTTTTEPPVNVNVSDTGANIETKPPVTSKPLSPSPSTDFGDTLGGANIEFDSNYYSPYRIPTNEEEDAPVTRQQVQSLDEKLDQLLASTRTYNDVVLKAFLDTTFEQYTEAIDKSTKVVEASTSSCQKATTDVAKLIYSSQIFLESLNGHAHSNAATINASVDSLSKSLQEEHAKFENVRSSIQAENTSLLSSVNSRLETLHVDLAKESALREDLARQTSTIEVQTVQLA